MTAALYTTSNLIHINIISHTWQKNKTGGTTDASHLLSLYITLSNHLPNPRAHDEVGGSFNANTRLQERLEAVPLPAEAVHDFSSYNSNVSISNDEVTRRDIPGLTRGALSMNDSRDSTAYKGWKFSSPLEMLRYWTRVRSSARIVKSKIKGVASKESCPTKSDSDQTKKINS